MDLSCKSHFLKLYLNLVLVDNFFFWFSCQPCPHSFHGYWGRRSSLPSVETLVLIVRFHPIFHKFWSFIILSYLAVSSSYYSAYFTGRIDATDSRMGLARMVNDAKASSPSCNCKIKKIEIKGKPHLVLFATKSISEGCELRYDYGDPSAWWRRQVSTFCKRVMLVSCK